MTTLNLELYKPISLDQFNTLSDTELDILLLYLANRTKRDIQMQLQLSDFIVSGHLHLIYSKLGIYPKTRMLMKRKMRHSMVYGELRFLLEYVHVNMYHENKFKARRKKMF